MEAVADVAFTELFTERQIFVRRTISIQRCMRESNYYWTVRQSDGSEEKIFIRWKIAIERCVRPVAYQVTCDYYQVTCDSSSDM